MSFIHESPDWGDLLRIVADRLDRDIGMVEKDYWVTHTLWAIHEQGFEVWFKGGTSLSKGFGLIDRFSEDIDVRIDAGTTGLTDPRLSWKNRKAGVAERDGWFDALAERLEVPGCEARRDALGSDEQVRSAWIEVRYPARHTATLPDAMRPFVLLEAGRARVTPFVPIDLSSWVHDHLDREGFLAEFDDTRPRAVRCVHPWVTALEKLEAVARRFEAGKEPASFVRHYEDVARILRVWDELPAIGMSLAELIAEMAAKDKTRVPGADHAAFRFDADERWDPVVHAWRSIDPMFWGPRVELHDACDSIRRFLAGLPRP